VLLASVNGGEMSLPEAGALIVKVWDNEAVMVVR
jgi:hypothetical protein